MLSFLTRLAVRRSSVTVLMTVAILIFGIFAATQLKQELTPSIDFPVITIITNYPGAESQAVADTVSAPVEQAVSGVQGLQNVQSNSTNGISIVVATFEYGTDIKAAQSTISSNVQSVTLPTGATAPKVQSFNLSTQPILLLSLSSSTRSPAELAQIARDQLIPAFKKVDGVFSVDVSGGGSHQLVIKLDPAGLAAKKISVQQVTGALQANSLTIPGGTVDQQGFFIPVVTTHKFQSVQDICNLVVGVSIPTAPDTSSAPPSSTSTSSTGTGSTGSTGLCQPATRQPGMIVLSDIATIAQSDTPTDGISRTNGQPSVGIAISKTQDANTVTVSDAVNAKLTDLKSKLPNGVTVTILQDQATFIKQSINELVKEGLLGAGFAVLVIFLFLLNVRSTLVSAISIPVSLLVAFITLYAAGISLNVLTLGGLAIAIGRVVDDAVVVLENIYRHVQAGAPPHRAVITATREVSTAVTASTATTLAVFAPLAFTGGLVGEFFRPFALAVVVALAASLFVALTIIPVLAKYFVRQSRRAASKANAGAAHEENTWLQRAYTPILSWALGHRALTLLVAVALFVGSLATIPLIPTSFLSEGGQKLIAITVSPPPGADVQAVSDEAAKVENILLDDGRVKSFQTTIGSGGSTQALRALFTGGAGNSASITAYLKDSADLPATASDLRTRLTDASVAGQFAIKVQDSAASSSQFQVTLSGSDTAQLADAGKRVLDVVKAEDNVANPTSNASAVAPTIFVNVDPAKASLFGLTTAQVGQQVRAALAAQTAVQVTTNDVNGGQPTDVVVQVDPRGLKGSAGVDLANLPILYGGAGRAGVIPLGQIAKIAVQPSQVLVTRIGGQPSITISADVLGQNTGSVSSDLQKKINDLSLPGGITVAYGGITSQLTTGFNGLLLAMVAAVVLVYLLMVLTFGSLVDPFILLFSLPLAAIGAFPALLVTGRTLSISAMIGLLMLVGIVVTNAIVLLDMVKQRERQGMATRDALLAGARIRVRPILMTAVATILATLPEAIGSGNGSFIAGDLGMVVIGGLLSSTFLTLVGIPVLYSLVSGMKRRLGFKGPQGENDDREYDIEKSDTERLPAFDFAAGTANTSEPYGSRVH
ncbi:MAG: efflux RND transporter permease subunit [Ktedonobacterales bacterium]